MTLLEVRNLTATVRSGSSSQFSANKKIVLNEASLTIEKGKITGLLGGSGGGKTTLAKCIAGLHLPDDGEIVFDNVNLYPNIENRSRFPLDIQLLFQASGASLDPTMTVEECLMEAIEAAKSVRGSGSDSPDINESLNSVGMGAEFLSYYPAQLSGGQRQRVAIARSLAAKPRLLILDEPTSALDVVSREQIIMLIKELKERQGFAVLLITHDVTSALVLSDRIAVLHEGRIIEEDTPHNLLRVRHHPYTEQLFKQSFTHLNSRA